MGPEGSFLHVLMTQQICKVPQIKASKSSKLKVVTFFFLASDQIFQTSFKSDEKVWGKQGKRRKRRKPREPQGIKKGIKNLKATPLVSIKGPVDEETKICS